MVVTETMLQNRNNGEIIKGTILLRDMQRALTRNGKPYYTGSLCSGSTVTYKAWNESSAFQVLDKYDLSCTVVDFEGTWNEYNGIWSIVLSSVRPSSSDVGVEEFLPTIYNIDAFWQSLRDKASENLSDKAMQIANRTLFENEAIAHEFKTGFAASSHHDNVKGGLLAHTYKVFTIAVSVMNMYAGICDKDLVLLGCLLHDIGKVREMHLGVYQDVSKVTHRFLGVEMIDKAQVVELFGEAWYYDLVSILLQHHDEFGEPCKTVSAEIVHLIDHFEAKMTMLKQSIAESEGSGTIRFDDAYLHYMVGGADDGKA